MRGSTCVWALALSLAAGCAGDGCACMTDIPNGFPAAERHEGVVQARVTPTGLEAIADNADALVDALFPDGLSFDVPASCGGDRKVCCFVPAGYCEMLFDLEPRPGDSPRIAVEPSSGDTSELTLRARVRTARAMPVHQAGLFGDIECYVSYDSRWSGSPHVTITADLSFEQDPATGTTRVEVGGASVFGISSSDVSIGGGFLCGLGDPADAAAQMQAQFTSEIPDAISDFVCKKCESNADCSFGTCSAGGVCMLDDEYGTRCLHDIGLQGRLPANELLGSLMPAGEDRDLDLYIALGGYGHSPNDGLSLGVLGGALPASTSVGNPCVPAVPAPPRATIAPSSVLEGNVHPRTGEPFDIGLGIHTTYLDRAAWAAHQAGYLCIDVGAARVPLLNTDALSILAPSMIDLVHSASAPMFLSLRPQSPPTIAPGAGTYTDSGDLDEPLLTVSMTDVDIDLYAFIDQRYVRLLTLRADLVAGLGLMINDQGNVEVVLGDLADALTNLRVTNAALLDESPEALVDKFPAVLSVALPMLADGLGDRGGLALPGFAGLTLDIAEGGFTSIEGDAFLAIFGDLVPAPEPAAAVSTTARLVDLAVPATDAFRAARLDRAARPTATLELGGDGEGDLEWQVRVDHGLWSPFFRDRVRAVSREGFWLQGHHVVEVRAREVGKPRTLDPTPEIIDLVIDTVAPAVDLRQTNAGFSVAARDGVSPAELLTVRYRLDGGLWLPAGAPPVELTVSPSEAAVIEVAVLDEAGNATTETAQVIGFHGRTTGGGGCDCAVGDGAQSAGGIALSVLIVFGLVGAHRRRRRRWGWLAAAAVALIVGCGGDVGGGDGDGDGDDAPPDPTVVHPGPTGRWSDIAAAEGRVVVSAYEEKHGDLVFGVVDADGEVSFAPVDGVPDVPPLLDPAGYRGGSVEPGDDVGAWTSMALVDGLARIAYQDIGAGALKLAVEDASGSWATHVVDPGDGAPAGAYASLAMDDAGVPCIAYMTRGIGADTGGFVARLMWARATSAAPAGPADWMIGVVDEVPIPCTGLCGDDQVCVAATDTCAAPDPDGACGESPCGDGLACVAGACVEIRPTPAAAELPEGVGLFASAGFLPDGRAVVSYYDRIGADLYLAVDDEESETGWRREGISVSPGRDAGQWSSLAVAADGTVYVAYQDAGDDSLHVATWRDGEVTASELVDDGRRDRDRPHPVGASAAITVAADGTVSVAYQDAATADLLVATRDGDGAWSVSEVLAGDNGYGFWIAAAAVADALWVSNYVYDRAVFPPGETAVVRAR